LVWYQLLGKARRTTGRDFQKGSLLGPSFTAAETRAALDRLGAKYQRFDDQGALFDRIATLIASEKVIGLMQGRMEFGPRALGNRSIVGDARSTAMQSVMNLKTKFRESFRPFAPSVLREHVHDWFEVRREEDSPYMLLVADVRADKRIPIAQGEREPTGIDRLKRLRSVVPAITHVDDSARIQTVDPERHPRYHQIISRFRDQTGCPVIINTSFNVRGEPIVCTPEDAYRCFMVTNMDVLVIDDFVLLKEEQPQAKQHDIDLHLANFDLD
jgi:carbamoyltransferase